jgi:DNA-binding transcriptional ArsR family regulator
MAETTAKTENAEVAANSNGPGAGPKPEADAPSPQSSVQPVPEQTFGFVGRSAPEPLSNPVPALKALAHETRYRIVELLLGHDLCVRALAARLGVSEAAVSQHLQVLRKAGLVRGERRGYWTHYAVEREALRSLAETLTGLAAKRRCGCACGGEGTAGEGCCPESKGKE